MSSETKEHSLAPVEQVGGRRVDGEAYNYRNHVMHFDLRPSASLIVLCKSFIHYAADPEDRKRLQSLLLATCFHAARHPPYCPGSRGTAWA